MTFCCQLGIFIFQISEYFLLQSSTTFCVFLVSTNGESIIQSSTNKLTPKITQLQLETPHSIVLDLFTAEAPTCSRFPCKLEHFPRERGPGDELLNERDEPPSGGEARAQL